MLFKELWSARGTLDSRSVCELNRATAKGEKEPFYQLTMTEGPFSGYPSIDLTFRQLVALQEAINKEVAARRAIKEIKGMIEYLGEGWSDMAIPKQQNRRTLEMRYDDDE